MEWTFSFKDVSTNMWLQFSCEAENKEEAALKLHKETRISGYDIPMNEIASALKPAEDDSVTG